MRTPIWIATVIAEYFYKQGLGFWNLGRREEAVASFSKALALKPVFPEANAHRSLVLRLLQRYDEALADADKAIALKPDDPIVYYSRGCIMVDKGDMQEAQRMFDKGLALQPNYTQILAMQASTNRYQNTYHPHREYFTSLLDNPATPPSHKVSLHFALGKIYNDCGLYNEAFLHYQQGNDLHKKGLFHWHSYKPKAVTDYTDRIIEVFSKEMLSRPLLPDNLSSPIFIVGMPRSGTTLTAQILSNHPAVASAGEHSMIRQFTLRLPKLIKKRISYPEAIRYLTPAIARRLADEYERRIRSERGIDPDVPFIVNKLTLNFQHLGFIAMLFPRARIIHCVRHPLDTAISNYFQQFGQALNYVYDLRHIGHFYNEYVKLMGHWRKVLPLPILDVRYEDTIVDTEQAVRRMLDFLELEWNERCLAPHTNFTPVLTASYWQVRQPIYQHSIGRWRHYEKHLGPLKEMLVSLCDDRSLTSNGTESDRLACG